MPFSVIDTNGNFKITTGASTSSFTVTATGNIDDLGFSNANIIRMNNASLATIRGLKAGTDGQQVTIVSIGAGQVNLSHQDAGDGTAASRLINTATSGITPLAAGAGKAIYEYDATTARWRLVHHCQGALINIAYSSGDYTASGSGTWTVDAGDVLENFYYLEGGMLHWWLGFNATTVGGTPSTELRVANPNGYTSAGRFNGYTRSSDAGAAYSNGLTLEVTTDTFLRVYKSLGGGDNWSLATNTTVIEGIAFFPIN
jgi:hypothetical protein